MHLEFIRGYGIIIGYFIVCASAALLLRHFIDIPKEVFRKVLHFILLGSIFIWIYAFETWWISAVSAIVFIFMVFPILHFAENIPGYSELLIERKKGKIKKSQGKIPF